jgi:hypothetical protein
VSRPGRSLRFFGMLSGEYVYPSDSRRRQEIRITVIGAISLIILLSAEAEDSARIYVYAQRQTAASSWLPISCGNAVVAELKRGTFFAITVAPGRYSFGIERGMPTIIEVGPGEESFVRLDWNFGMNRPPIPELHAVRPDQARTDMKYLSYINANKVLSGSVAQTDPREPVPLRLKRRNE